jgi:MFS family permease
MTSVAPRTPAVRRSSWLLVAPAVTMTAWGGNHFTPLLLLYRRVEGYTALDVDIFFAAYVLGLVPGFLVASRLSDRYGRRPLTLAAVLLGIAASAVLAVAAPSAVLLCVGRLIAGLSVAIAMAVGSSWIKELSTAAIPPADGSAAARRAALTVTVGFGAGAGVAGVLAQWAPLPTLLPYVVQVVLAAASIAPLLRAPETRAARVRGAARAGATALDAAGRRHLGTVVVPAAPWVFGCAAVAFVIIPAQLERAFPADGIAVASLLTVVGLTFGAAVQPFAHRIGALTGGRQLPVGLALAVVGIVLAAVEAAAPSLWLGVVCAAMLGLGYGVVLVSGLAEVQRIAPPDRLAGLTGVYYSLTYSGFLLPPILAAVTPLAPVGTSLLVVAALCAACAIVVTLALGRQPESTARH